MITYSCGSSERNNIPFEDFISDDSPISFSFYTFIEDSNFNKTKVKKESYSFDFSNDDIWIDFYVFEITYDVVKNKIESFLEKPVIIKFLGTCESV